MSKWISESIFVVIVEFAPIVGLQMNSRLPYRGMMIIDFHILLKYESSRDLQSWEICVSCSEQIL